MEGDAERTAPIIAPSLQLDVLWVIINANEPAKPIASSTERTRPAVTTSEIALTGFWLVRTPKRVAS